MKTVALVVAAGRGSRAGTDLPKQYCDLGGKSVLGRTVEALLSHVGVDACLVAIHPQDRALYDAAVSGVDDPRLLPPTPGGRDRQDSVRLGLAALAAYAPDIVLIHDAARPFVSHDVIERVIDGARQHGAAFAALPLVDTLWRESGGVVRDLVPRDGLWRAQTPQGFRFDLILDAHNDVSVPATDDVAIARAAGHRVAVVLGDGNNFKITLPEDFARARRLLGDDCGH